MAASSVSEKVLGSAGNEEIASYNNWNLPFCVFTFSTSSVESLAGDALRDQVRDCLSKLSELSSGTPD